MSEQSSVEAGESTMRRLFGRVPDRAYIPEEFFQNMVERVYGELWNGPELDMEDRSLITVALLAAQGKQFEMEIHLKGAKRLGHSRAKVEALMTHIAFYCGWPAALQGFKSIDRVWDDRAEVERA